MIAPDVRRQVANAADFGRVAVMLGGNSSERAVSLDSGNAVLEALQSRGIDAVAWDPAEHNLRKFAAAGFDRVWIALHGPGGEDGALQGALQWLGMPYTGSGVMASAIAMDKVRSKHLFKAAGIVTPAYRVFESVAEARRMADALDYPLMVKPSQEGSSVGISKIFEKQELDEAAATALEFDGPGLLEACVVGDEITVTVLQGEPLPSIRIETPRVFYDYRAKYESDRTTYTCPGCPTPEDETRHAEAALAAFAALGCCGWGRVDFMTGRDGIPQAIEINTVPGMTSHSLVPMAAKKAGIDFAELCWRVLETSMPADAAAAAKEVANGA